MEAVKSILEKTKIQKGEPHTHVTPSTPHSTQGSYYIDGEHEEAFLKAYCDAVYIGKKLSIAETVDISDLGPLIADFDFTSPLTTNAKRVYDDTFVTKIVGFYQEEMAKIIDPTEFQEDMLICIVLEKEAPRIIDSEHLKDGFHLHFPNFVCLRQVQNAYLRGRVIAKIIESELLKGTGIVTPVDKFIDDLGRKPWMMYGSMNYKDKHSTPYLYMRKQSQIEGSTFNTETDPWKDIKSQYGHVFNRHLREIPMLSVFELEMEGFSKNIRYNLPRLLKIRDHIDETPLKQVLFEPKAYGRKTKKPNTSRNDEDIYKDIKTIMDGHIMDMLSQERADGHDSWIDVGIVLYNITCGKEEGLRLWEDFSRRSAKYKPGECQDKWEHSFEVRGMTMGSLMWMAKTDSPREYAQYKKTSTTYHLYESVKVAKYTDYRIAMVCISRMGDKFKCAKPKGDGRWFKFENHRWRETEDAIAVKQFLLDDVRQQYQEFIWELSDSIKNNPPNCSELEDYRKRAIKIVDYLESVPGHKRVVEMCKSRLTDETFLKKINERRLLVCCENGVLDLERGIFREGRPDDYCTFSTGIDYHNYNPGDEDVVSLDTLLRKTFTNENIREYFLDMASSCLEGGNVNKCIFMCTGETNGGKSVMIKILEHAFGEYIGNFPRELFLKGKGVSSAQARPELSQTPGKKVMTVNEITHMEQFDIGPLKLLSGSDSMFYRGVYKDGGKNEPQFTIIMQCNKPPDIPGDDEAVWTRMKIIRFTSMFVLPSKLRDFPVPSLEKEQFEQRRFHAETGFFEKNKFLSDVFLWKIFTRFQTKKGGLSNCKEVEIATDAYKTDNDIYEGFVKHRLEEEKDEEKVKSLRPISIPALYSAFKEWYRTNYPSYWKTQGYPGQMIVTDKLRKKIGDIDIGKNDKNHGFGENGKKKEALWGYTLIMDDDDDDDVQKKIGDTHT